MGCNCSGWPVEELALREIVMFEVPEGVMMGGGVVIAALPPPQPARAKVMQKIVTGRTPQRAMQFVLARRRNTRAFLLKNASKKKSRASKVGTDRGTRETGRMWSGADGGNWAGPLVETVTVNIAAPPASETLAGNWQTAPRGTPPQLSETVPV